MNVFEPKPNRAFIQFFKISLRKPSAIVMQTYEKFVVVCILCKMNETGIAMLEDIIYQFLDHAKNDQFIFGLHPFSVIMKTGTGIHAARAADFLKEIIHC